MALTGDLHEYLLRKQEGMALSTTLISLGFSHKAGMKGPHRKERTRGKHILSFAFGAKSGD